MTSEPYDSLTAPEPDAHEGDSAGVPDASRLLVAVVDEDDRIRQVNRVFERVTEYPAEEVQGKRVSEFHVGLERNAGDGAPPGCRTLGEGRERAQLLLTRGGARRLVRWTVIHLQSPARGAARVCIGIDMSAWRPAELALHDRNLELRAVFDAAVDGIITIDAGCVIRSVNHAAERMFGYAEAELVGASVDILMPQHYRSRHETYLARYLQTGESRVIGRVREVQGLRRDGSVFPMELAVSEVTLTSGRMFTGILHDISARREMEAEIQRRTEELAHAARLTELGELTSSIAHEINQPLTAIVSFAEAGKRLLGQPGGATGERLERILEQVAAQGTRAAEIVRNLRVFLRKGATVREAVDVGGAIRDVIDLLGYELRRHAVDLTLDLEPDLPPVSGDRVQLQQVILNLVNNASDAVGKRAAAERHVAVRCARDREATVCVTVCDSGCGLPSGAEEHLFDTFFTTKEHGMGLGLAIARTLVEAHGGRIEARNNAGAGATFRVYLPVGQGAAAPDGR